MNTKSYTALIENPNKNKAKIQRNNKLYNKTTGCLQGPLHRYKRN